MSTSVENGGSARFGFALKSDELTNYKLVDRENPNLNFNTLFVKIG